MLAVGECECGGGGGGHFFPLFLFCWCAFICCHQSSSSASSSLHEGRGGVGTKKKGSVAPCCALLPRDPSRDGPISQGSFTVNRARRPRPSCWWGRGGRILGRPLLMSVDTIHERRHHLCRHSYALAAVSTHRTDNGDGCPASSVSRVPPALDDAPPDDPSGLCV